MKIRPSSERYQKFQRPKTPDWMKLLILGLACVAAGIERWYFLALGVILLALSYLSHRRDGQRLGTEIDWNE